MLPVSAPLWLVLGAGLATAAPALDPAAALRSLGPLGPPLAEAGWELVPAAGGALRLGDILDPTDDQLQVRGPDCFAVDRARQSAGVAAAVDRALAVEGGLPLGGLGVQGRAAGTLRLRLDAPAVHELATTELRPAPACAELLRSLAADGVPVGRYTVVQSILVADLTVDGCAALSAGAGGGPQAAVSRCAGIAASGATVALRREPLGEVLARAGIAVAPGPAAAPPGRRKRKAPPCWVDSGCRVAPVAEARQGVGHGADMAAADAAARAALLAPFLLRMRAADPGPRSSAVPGAADGPGPVEEVRALLLETIEIRARHQDPATRRVASLALLDRAAVDDRLGAALAPLEAQLAAVAPGALAPLSPLARLAALRGADAAARRAEVLRAARAALVGPGPAAPAWQQPAALAAARQAARSAVLVRVEPGPLAPTLRLAAGMAGLPLVDAGPAPLVLRGSLRADEGAAAGMVRWTVAAEVELAPEGLPVQRLAGREAGAGSDGAKVRKQVEDAVTEAMLVQVQAALGGLL